MKIIFTRFPLESRYGGAEVQTLNLMKGLVEKGHDVEFVGSCSTLLEKCQVFDFRFQGLDIGPPPVTKWSAVSFLWRQFGMKKKLIGEMRTSFDTRNVSSRVNSQSEIVSRDNHGATQEDIIIMLSLSEKLLLTPWCIQNGIKVIWIEHDRVGRWLTHNPWLLKLRSLSQKVTTVVVSDLSKKIYMNLGWKEKNLVTIPNGIDIDTLKPSFVSAQDDAVNITKPNKPFRIGCISRLTTDKGIDLLIDATKEFNDIKLTIIGTGREEERLKKQISQITNKPKSQITITNHVENISDFYRDIDALILPSRSHDPFGLVVAEAMAAGVPTICTDVCGIASYLDAKSTIVVKANNAQSIKNGIEKIRDQNTWNLLHKNGPQVAKKLFSLKKMVDQYEHILTS